jgi:hypothetical protein
METLASLGDRHDRVLDEASHPPQTVFENGFEAVGTWGVVETELGEIEVGLPAVTGKVVSRFAHPSLHVE